MRQNTSAERFSSVPVIEKELRTRLPWLWHPWFRISENQGFDGQTFGARAGPADATNAWNVLHEVGHAVEMTLLPARIWKRRVKKPNFEMRITTFQTVLGRRYYEPETMQATERECRVGGIQLRLLEAAGYRTADFIQEFALTLKYMADWYKGGSCPLNAHDVEKFDEDQKLWLCTRMSLVRQAYDRFDLSEVQTRWTRVMDWLPLTT